MTQVDIRANLAVLGLRIGQEALGVELTPMLARAADDGRITILARYPDPDGEVIAVAAGRPMTDAEVVAAGGKLELADDVPAQWICVECKLTGPDWQFKPHCPRCGSEEPAQPFDPPETAGG